MAEIMDSIVPAPGQAPKISENALTVLKSRYLLRDRKGKCIETPAQLFSRVASMTASAEKRYGSTPEKIKAWHRRFMICWRHCSFCPTHLP